jgi:hypothetical protein
MVNTMPGPTCLRSSAMELRPCSEVFIVGIGELHPDRRREHGHGRGGPRSDRRCGSGGAPPRVTAVMSAGASASAGELCHHCRNEKRVREVTRYEQKLAAARPRPDSGETRKICIGRVPGERVCFFTSRQPGLRMGSENQTRSLHLGSLTG